MENLQQHHRHTKWYRRQIIINNLPRTFYNCLSATVMRCYPVLPGVDATLFHSEPTFLALVSSETRGTVTFSRDMITGRVVQAVTNCSAVLAKLPCRTGLFAGGANVACRAETLTGDDVAGRLVVTSTLLLAVGSKRSFFTSYEQIRLVRANTSSQQSYYNKFKSHFNKVHDNFIIWTSDQNSSDLLHMFEFFQTGLIFPT